MTSGADVGKLLFGRSLRLEFGDWVHRRGGEPFYVSEVQNALDTSPSGVHEELRRFTKLGMLDRLPKGGDRRQYYRKTNHPLWDVFAVTRSIDADRRKTTTEPDQLPLTSMRPDEGDAHRPAAMTASPLMRPGGSSLKHAQSSDPDRPDDASDDGQSDDGPSDDTGALHQFTESADADTRDPTSDGSRSDDPSFSRTSAGGKRPNPAGPDLEGPDLDTSDPPAPDSPDASRTPLTPSRSDPGNEPAAGDAGDHVSADVEAVAAVEGLDRSSILARQTPHTPTPQPVERSLGDLLDDASWRTTGSAGPPHRTDRVSQPADVGQSATLAAGSPDEPEEPEAPDGPSESGKPIQSHVANSDDTDARASSISLPRPSEDVERPWWERDAPRSDSINPWSEESSTTSWRPVTP